MLLLEDALKAFDALKQAYTITSILAFTDYTKEFLLETNTSKEGLGMVLSQKQAEGDTIWSPMAAKLLWLMKETTTPPNLSSWH